MNGLAIVSHHILDLRNVLKVVLTASFPACVTITEGSDCQSKIASIESSSKVTIYNLNTVGTTNMITEDGKDLATFSDNKNAFASTIALFRI
jgi:hypothetical protein